MESPILVCQSMRPKDSRGAASAAPARPEAAGLVISKTSQTFVLPIDKQSLRERRLAHLRKNVWLAGNLLNMEPQHGLQCVMVTPTYRQVGDWHPKHLSRAIDAYRKWCLRHSITCQYVWVAELQQRGAVHYHIACWIPKRLTMPKWDKQGWWPHGMTNNKRAKKSGGCAYLMKYMSKIGGFHEFPKGCRLHGSGGLTKQARQIKQWCNFPLWIKAAAGVGEVCTKFGRRVVLATGEVLKSPFKVVFTRSGLHVFSDGPLPERFWDGPYSTVRFGEYA